MIIVGNVGLANEAKIVRTIIILYLTVFRKVNDYPSAMPHFLSLEEIKLIPDNTWSDNAYQLFSSYVLHLADWWWFLNECVEQFLERLVKIRMFVVVGIWILIDRGIQQDKQNWFETFSILFNQLQAQTLLHFLSAGCFLY